MLRLSEVDAWVSQMVNLLPPPGFKGFDPNGSVRIYQRHLPHWRQEGVTYFVTFRLADALPAGRVRELKELRRQWEQRHPVPRKQAAWEGLMRTMMERVERWLDGGAGCCLLQHDMASAVVERTLRHDDGARYDLQAFVIMPNHAHALVCPYSDAHYPLERAEQAWKSNSSRELRGMFGERWPQWQQESFDRIVRDEEHLLKCLHYIGSNPRRAGLNAAIIRRWVRSDWRSAGWRFDDDIDIDEV